VLVEKPMALGRREAQELAAAAAGSALVLGVGFHLRHSDVFRELKRLILAGAVGDPRFVRAAWGMPLPELSGWKQDRAQAGAGALMGLAVHLLDLVLWLVDAPVGAVTAMSDAHEERLDRNYVIAFEIGGCMVEISVSRSFALGASLVLFGTDGALWAEDAVTVRAEGTLRDGGGAVLVKAASNPYAVELRTFADAASGGPRFHADASDGLRCVELTDAVLAATAAA
jgi:predicted dehydrogenase